MPDVDGRTVFDEAAMLYDRARPSYPEALVADVVSYANLPADGRILEIGCGSGKATVLFAKCGIKMLCVEPGPNLAAIAREKCNGYPVEFEVSSFEDWSAGERTFSLVYLASAFHWLPEESALPKIASVLMPGGALALFWNRHLYPQSEALEEIKAATLRYRADYGFKTEVGEDLHQSIQEQVKKIDSSGLFAEVSVKTYPWTQTYSAREYIDLLDSYSGFRVMESDAKRALFDEVASIIERHGGRVTRQYTSLLYLTKKRP